MARQILSVDEVLRNAERWDDQYLRIAIHAIQTSVNDPDHQSEMIDEFLSYRNRGAFKATNPYSKKLFLPELLIEVRAAISASDTSTRRPRYKWGRHWPCFTPWEPAALALVTITDETWACSDKNIVFDLRRAKQKVRNALRGVNYIARFEAAHYVNEEHVTDGVRGNLVLFHCHALVWASSHSMLKRMRTRTHSRFNPMRFAKSGMQVDRIPSVDEVPRVVAYVAKLPVMGYLRLTGGGKNRQGRAKLRPGSRYQFFSYMRDYSLFDFWFAGGEGKAPLREARKRLEASNRPALRIRHLGRPRRHHGA